MLRTQRLWLLATTALALGCAPTETPNPTVGSPTGGKGDDPQGDFDDDQDEDEDDADESDGGSKDDGDDDGVSSTFGSEGGDPSGDYGSSSGWDPSATAGATGDLPDGDFGCPAYCAIEIGCFDDFWMSQEECEQWCTSIPTDEACAGALETMLVCLGALSCEELDAFWMDPESPDSCVAENEATVQACDGGGGGTGGGGSSGG